MPTAEHQGSRRLNDRPSVEDSATLSDSTSFPDLPQIATDLGVRFIESLLEFQTSDEFVARIPIAFARQHGLMGLIGDNGSFLLALSDDSKWRQLDIIGRFLKRNVIPILCPAEAVQSAINLAYQQRSGEAIEMIQSLDRTSILSELKHISGREDLLDGSGRAPVVKLVNLLLFEAVQCGASDIHIQPTENKLAVRLRLDGILFDAFELPLHFRDEVIGRLKVMGRMNIAEKRLAQDGRATAQVGERAIDLRLASLPTSHGERMVIRLLDKSARLYQLGELGMGGVMLSRFRQLIGLDHGLVLVTGPTGSGKTTTLYAALKEIDFQQHNVLTLEDPIEYQLEGISQTQVSDKKGMTFASGLRSVLRQDPDIIMVGEIRDRETASMAIQSALTGHLVFSTLHTNDAASAVTRLLDLGVEPYLVASSVAGVLAQRLVRRVCPTCSKPHCATSDEIAWLDCDQPPLGLRRGDGCKNCRQTGYRGRIGIFELMIIDQVVRQQIHIRAPANLIKTVAQRSGMRTLRDDGVARILAGVTTIEEVERVTTRASESELA